MIGFESFRFVLESHVKNHIKKSKITCKQTGMDPIERLRFLAPGTGAREGGEKMQPFNRFPSHRVTVFMVNSDKIADLPSGMHCTSEGGPGMPSCHVR